MTLATPFFEKFLRDHVRTIPGDVRIKFEVRTFNRFGAIKHLTLKYLGVS